MNRETAKVTPVTPSNNIPIPTNKSYYLNQDNVKHNLFTSENIRKGILGETFIQYFFNKILRIAMQSNNLDPGEYNNERGPDLYNYDLAVYVQVQNNNGSYYLQYKDMKRINEGVPDWARYKLLFIANDTLTQNCREILKAQGWQIFDWGEQLTGQNFKGALNRLKSKFWSTYYKLKSVSRLSLNNKSNNISYTNLNNYITPNKYKTYTIPQKTGPDPGGTGRREPILTLNDRGEWVYV